MTDKQSYECWKYRIKDLRCISLVWKGCDKNSVRQREHSKIKEEKEWSNFTCLRVFCNDDELNKLIKPNSNILKPIEIYKRIPLPMQIQDAVNWQQIRDNKKDKRHNIIILSKPDSIFFDEATVFISMFIILDYPTTDSNHKKKIIFFKRYFLKQKNISHKNI